MFIESEMHTIACDLEINPETYRIINAIRNDADGITEPCEKVVEIMRKTRYKSDSTEWHNVRGRLLTASDMAGVLGDNPYSSPNAVFLKKTHQSVPFKGNVATRWGQRYEQEAADVYQKLTGMPLITEDIGLIVHPYEKIGDEGRKRYAATPDRLAWNGKCIEIKCPFRRKITHDVPKYYMAQIQCQLEVTGCKTLHFVQYRPKTVMAKGVFDIVQVERDPDWWTSRVPIMDLLWDRVIAFHNERNLEVGDTHALTPRNEVVKKRTKIRASIMCIVSTDY